MEPGAPSPETLSLVTALLAQGPGFPAGDTAQGLDLHLALTPDGRLDPVLYQHDPRPWRARRFYPDRADWHGEVVHEDELWTLRGAPAADGPLWFLEASDLRPGAMFVLRRPDGETLLFRVVSIGPG